MPIGTPLATLRQMLNCEVGAEMDETISSANIQVNNQLLNNQQAFLARQHAYLRGRTQVEVPLVVGAQYIPTATPVGGTPLTKLIDLDSPETHAYVNFNNFRYTLTFGIGQPEYNIYNSAYGVAGVPAMKWDLKNNQSLVGAPAGTYPGGGASTLTYNGLLPGQTYIWSPGVNESSLTYNGATYSGQGTFTAVSGVTTAAATGAANSLPFTGQLNAVGMMIETWPIPSVPQSLELAGLLPITQMQNDTDTCVIDDLLLVLFTAAEILARQSLGDAQAKITKAQAHLRSLQASYPNKFEKFNLSGGSRYIEGFETGRGRPVIAVNASH